MEGWEIYETGGSANTSYTLGSGSSATGDTYSFGSDTDRALGAIRDSTLHSRFGVGFVNGGTTAIGSFGVNFDGEMWRRGQAGSYQDELHFEYRVGATGASDPGTWNGVGTFMFTSPNANTAISGAVNGNDLVYRKNISSTLVLNLNPGESVFFRWNDQNAPGGALDDGLAIDNFAMTANFTAVPEPASLCLVGTALVCGLHLVRRRRKLA